MRDQFAAIQSLFDELAVNAPAPKIDTLTMAELQALLATKDAADEGDEESNQ